MGRAHRLDAVIRDVQPADAGAVAALLREVPGDNLYTAINERLGYGPLATRRRWAKRLTSGA